MQLKKDWWSSAQVLFILTISPLLLIYIPFLTRVRDSVSKSIVISTDDRIFDGRRWSTGDNVASWRCTVPVPWRCTDKYRGSLKAETQRSLLRLPFQSRWGTKREKDALLLTSWPQWHQGESLLISVEARISHSYSWKRTTDAVKKAGLQIILKREQMEFIWGLNALFRHTHLTSAIALPTSPTCLHLHKGNACSRKIEKKNQT